MERHSSRRLRLILAWALSAAVIASYYLIGDSGGGDEDGLGSSVARSPTTPAPQPDEDEGKLEILEVDPGEATPGGALQVRYAGVDDDQVAAGTKVRALLSAPSAPGAKSEVRELEVLHAKKDELFLRVPADAPPARHKLRLQYGDNRDTRSKPYDLRVKPLNRQKLFRNVIGGLALLVFGLRTMSRGSRGYTGQRSQGFIAAIARRRGTAIGLGAVVGGVTQFTTTAAGLVVGLIGSHLLTAGPAVAVMLGAQLGAAAVPSVLGLTSTGREGLLLVSIGVLCLSLAGDRRGEALSKIILGCGLLFYGLHLLRLGLQPLVSDPELLPYIDRFQADNVGGLVACVGAGVVLSALLQGPAPVFAVVLGLTQATGRIDLQSGLAILAGTGLGASIGTAVVAWPFGAEPRRLARIYFLVALVGTLMLATTVNLWAYVADVLGPGDPGDVAYGKKVLLPNVGRHLVIGFALSQLAVTAVLAVALPALIRLAARLFAAEEVIRLPAPLTGTEGVRALREGLAKVLQAHRGALDGVFELCLTGHRSRGVVSEHALADARAELEALFGGAVRAGNGEAEMGRMRQAALATLQLQRAIEDLLRHGERTTERAMALSPAGQEWRLATGDAKTVRALHALLLEGLDDLQAQLTGTAPPDVDSARAREIRLNAMEAETRQALLAQADRGEEPREMALRLNTTDLINAFENVGNHLYRLHEALASEVEQDAAE